MDAANQGAADGSIGVDSLWKRKLNKLFAETPLAPHLLEAAAPLVDLLPEIDLDDLKAVIDDKRAEWRNLIYSEAGGFNLPHSYPLDYAVAIYLYTLAYPAVFSVVDAAMFNPSRRVVTGAPAGAAAISVELRACMRYIKFLDAALEALPPAYVFVGEVRRGVQWVYPSPERHDPKSYFAPGATLMWYEFKSTSREQEVMTRAHFCGVAAGPRTIFTIDACRGYSIEKFSYFQGTTSEFEVLFRPLSQFAVVHAQKNIIDPRETTSIERSGFPDAIALRQVVLDATPPPAPSDLSPGMLGGAPAPAAAPLEATADDDFGGFGGFWGAAPAVAGGAGDNFGDFGGFDAPAPAVGVLSPGMFGGAPAPAAAPPEATADDDFGGFGGFWGAAPAVAGGAGDDFGDFGGFDAPAPAPTGALSTPAAPSAPPPALPPPAPAPVASHPTAAAMPSEEAQLAWAIQQSLAIAATASPPPPLAPPATTPAMPLPPAPSPALLPPALTALASLPNTSRGGTMDLGRPQTVSHKELKRFLILVGYKKKGTFSNESTKLALKRLSSEHELHWNRYIFDDNYCKVIAYLLAEVMASLTNLS